jgi:hypothetical protein
MGSVTTREIDASAEGNAAFSGELLWVWPDRSKSMKAIKTIMIAALLAGASSLAMAQTSGSTAGNAATSGGSGTHQGAMRSGSASSNQKVLKNQNGYRGQQ